MKTFSPRRHPGALLGAFWLLTGGLAFAQAAAKPVAVVFETELGRITVEVDVARAPITSANFLRYVDGKYYDGAVINRSVRPDNTIRHDVEIQVIQLQENPLSRGRMFPAIPLERTSVTGLKHVDGTVSMARSGPDSAQAAFFISIGAQPELNFGGRRNADGQGFAAFGRVVEGMEVVKKIQASPTAATGEYGTETLAPPIRILKAYRLAAEYPQMGSDIYDVHADGARQIDAALAHARAEHKRVLVDFGANWCIWCRRLHHTFETDPRVAAELDDSFILVLVDVNSRGAAARNADLNLKYGNPLRFGIPVLTVLDADGRLLATKDSGELEEGAHHSPEKILKFLSAWSLKGR